MQDQGEKPLYWDNHEGFRRLLIAGSASVVVGVFFANKIASSEFLAWMQGWFATASWASGLTALAMCFLLNPKQYSIYPDSLAVEWWYFRRKVIPLDEVTEIQARSLMGRGHIVVLSRGPDYRFGFDAITPRQAETFARRLEEAVNRRRFYSGRDPIEVEWKLSRKDRKKKRTES